ncbi:MAG: hypothetical protein ACLUNZ_05400 [Evtepia sp.]
MLALMSKLNDIHRRGTPDIEFAVVGMLVRYQTSVGRALDARTTLESLRKRFVEVNEARPRPASTPCSAASTCGRGTWWRWGTGTGTRPPRTRSICRPAKRYQYLTQAMAEIALGNSRAALLTLAALEPYFTACQRHIDGIHLASRDGRHRPPPPRKTRPGPRPSARPWTRRQSTTSSAR